MRALIFLGLAWVVIVIDGTKQLRVGPHANGDSHVSKMGLIRAVGLSSDGTRAFVANSNHEIGVWDLKKRKLTKTIPNLSHHQSNILEYAFCREGKFAIMGYRSAVHTGKPNAIENFETLAFWDLSNGRKLRVFDNNNEPVNRVALSPDGKLAMTVSVHKVGVFRRSGSLQTYPLRAVRLWDTTTGKLVKTLVEESSGLLPIAFSPDGKRCIVGIARRDAEEVDKEKPGPEVKVWEAANGRALQSLHGLHAPDLTAVAFSPDSQFVLAAGYCNVGLWSLETANMPWTYRREGNNVVLAENWSIISMAYSPDGKFVVLAGNEIDLLKFVPKKGTRGGFHLLDAATGKKVQDFVAPKEWVRSVCFLPDGKLLCGATGEGLQFWDARTGEKRFILGE